MEAAAPGTFMISACVFAVLLEHPAATLHQAIANQSLRRILAGIAMDLTAVGIISSPDTPSRLWSDKHQSKFKFRIEMKQLSRVLPVFAVLALLVTVNSFAAKMDVHTSSMFQGPKANTGTVSHFVENGKSMLKVSDVFKVPDTPAPTWRVVDSNGNIYTLDAFKIKSGNKEKREIEVPSYVPNIAKVQVYCAWAEIILGEASFSQAVK
jgi:hypothetical protein